MCVISRGGSKRGAKRPSKIVTRGALYNKVFVEPHHQKEKRALERETRTITVLLILTF